MMASQIPPEERLRLLIEESGAVACGWCEAGPVAQEEWGLFEAWLARGCHAGMAYMENYPEIRRDPRLLLPGARTVISVAFNYRQPNPYRGKIATYALGQDYHKVLRKRLKKVVTAMKADYGGDWRICIDSAPILERYWAQKCGVGHRSPLHGNIIVPGVGSMVFLAEILTTLDLPKWRPLILTENAEGEKPGTAALENDIPARVPCPTGALQPGGIIDARRCINYLTIEHRGELSPAQKALVGDAVFGCDACQLACPSNRTPAPPVIPEFLPLPYLTSPTLRRAQNQKKS